MIKFAFVWTWRAVVILTPLLGVWLASSLASYFEGPRWAILGAGLLLFPLLPFTWEAWSARRRRQRDTVRKEKGKDPKKTWLSTFDRVVLRTLLVNITFIASLVALFPQAVFPALSTRGAWFLDGVAGTNAELGREILFASAGKLEWFYRLTHPNPYDGLGEGESGHDVAEGTLKTGTNTGGNAKGKGAEGKPPNEKDPKAHDKTQVAKGPEKAVARTWPASAKVHPGALAAPDFPELTVAQLGQYFRTIPDAYERVRAMHDWVATHISYDFPGLADGTYNTQQGAENVLRRRRGVCAGYSNLMAALGQASGDRIVYLTGQARDHDGNQMGDVGHAWNAVEIDGAWYLLDVTWDSGLGVGRPAREMRTLYFLAPPTAFALDHFPDDGRWQLLAQPMTRGEFFRQPTLTPLAVAFGIELRSPEGGWGLASTSEPRIVLEVPRGVHMLARAEAGNRNEECSVTTGDSTGVVCPMRAQGRYRVLLFASFKEHVPHDYVGSVRIDRQ